MTKTVQWYLGHPEWLLNEFSKAQFAKESRAFDEGKRITGERVRETVKGR